jgi:orotidine-5'-phosphate decarboxylase
MLRLNVDSPVEAGPASRSVPRQYSLTIDVIWETVVDSCGTWGNSLQQQQLSGQDRLIVALDVPTHDRALELVDLLDNVGFFKIGLELLLAGDLLRFLQRLQEQKRRTAGVFVDLKLGGDIGNTIASLVRQLQALHVKFLTLVESVPLAITLNSIKAAREARGPASDPQLLIVPCLSTMDQEDLRASGINTDLDSYIVQRARVMINGGCDGLIVSGQAIKLCRSAFPTAVIVSPGIRPAWASQNDHKRLTTPREAISLGADYLVVGRPITTASDPRGAAQLIIDEMDAAIADRPA